MSTPNDGPPGPSATPTRVYVPRVLPGTPTQAPRSAAKPARAPQAPRPPRPPRQKPARAHGPRPQHPRVRRVLKRTAVIVSALVLLVAAAGAILIAHYNGNITRLPVLGQHLTGLAKPPAAPRGAENFLLVGSDSRAGDNAGPNTGTERQASGQRSDTIILAHLFGKTDKAMMVSFPRDSWVQIPGWHDPKTGREHLAHYAKINSAIAEGGPALLVATVEQLTGIRVDHYAQVDFFGFQSMVNSLGGVDVCLSRPANDSYSGLVMSAGRHHINGQTALAFVRQRHGLPQGDIDRIKRQQQLLGSLVHKVLSAGTLLNPLKLNGFLNAATTSLKVDETMKFNDLKNLALRARHFQSAGVLFGTIPITKSNGFVDGQSVVLLDPTADQSLFDELRQDRLPGQAPPPTPTATATATTVAPADIQVRVDNGSGITGLARRAKADLTAKGFATTGTPTTVGTGAAATVVRYGHGKLAAAQAVAAALPGAQVRLDASLGEVVDVVIGSSYAQTAAPTPAVSSSAPAAKVPVRSAQQDPCA